MRGGGGKSTAEYFKENKAELAHQAEPNHAKSPSAMMRSQLRIEEVEGRRVVAMLAASFAHRVFRVG